jgi:coenzyme F420 biosynthesis associated uncharacterized protein
VDAAKVDWSMGSASARLADWSTAHDVGRRVAGPGVPVSAAERARIREDIAEQTTRSESLVSGFTGLSSEGFRARAWVMSRGEWIGQNLKAMQRLLEPLAERIVGEHRSEVRRKAFGAQFGVLLGYVSRKVLGQYDVFLPADDEGLIYFIGPNIAEAEQRFDLPTSDFRLWIALHEVTHRLQFGAAPWLRTYLQGLIDTYLATIQVDSKQMMQQLQRAAEEIRAGASRKGLGPLFLLLTPEQREIFYRMQSMMSLLEGHASFVMNEVANDLVEDLPRMRRALQQRRQASSLERTFQRAIGFESKIKQYDAGEYFVREVVARAGMEGLNRVWEGEHHLPTLAEVADPARWVERVVGT